MELGHGRTSAITSRKMGTLHESYPPIFILARSAKQKSFNLTKFPSSHGACTNSLTLPTKKTFNNVKKYKNVTSCQLNCKKNAKHGLPPTQLSMRSCCTHVIFVLYQRSGSHTFHGTGTNGFTVIHFYPAHQNS